MPTTTERAYLPSPTEFTELAHLQTNIGDKTTSVVFSGHFGLDPETATCVWSAILKRRQQQPQKSRITRPIHLLWALHFMKCYPSKIQGPAFCKTSLNTYKKFVRLVLEEIATLNRVSDTATVSIVDVVSLSYYCCVCMYRYDGNVVFFHNTLSRTA